MELLASAVVYDGLPISSGGAHTLRRVSARGAFTVWFDFLGSCTEPSPIVCWFAFPSTPGLDVDPRVVERVAREFPRRADGRHAVPQDRFDEALSLFESFEPHPVNSSGMASAWLWFTADFLLRAPDAARTWPGQDPARFGDFVTPGGVRLGASSTRLILQAKRMFGLSLSIPEASDDDLVEIVPWLQSALPVRLSSKHWTRWTRTRDGRSYRGRRITVPVLRS